MMIFRKTIIAVVAVASLSLIAPTDVSAGGGFRGTPGGGYHHGSHGGGWRSRGPVVVGAGTGLGFAGSSWDSGYEWGNSCVQPRQVWTDWGWRIAPVNVC